MLIFPPPSFLLIVFHGPASVGIKDKSTSTGSPTPPMAPMGTYRLPIGVPIGGEIPYRGLSL